MESERKKIGKKKQSFLYVELHEKHTNDIILNDIFEAYVLKYKKFNENDFDYIEGRCYKFYTSEFVFGKDEKECDEIEVIRHGLDYLSVGSEKEKKRENVIREIKTSPKHYDNSKGSLYKFAEDQNLNAYEFDIIKRIIRCRKKGLFREDLEKTKFLIDLYLKEYEDK